MENEDQTPSMTLRRFMTWTRIAHSYIDGRSECLKVSLICAALGMSGELSELQEDDADVLIEAGDVFSYALLAASILKLDPGIWLDDPLIVDPVRCKRTYVDQRPPGSRDLLHDALVSAARFSEMTKKLMVSGIRPCPKRSKLCLRTVIQRVAGFVSLRGISVQAVILGNKRKLAMRYLEATAFADAYAAA